MVGKTIRATAAQKRRMDAISKMGCVACAVLNQRQPNGTEVHHITSCGRRMGHDATMPLCKWMHRGVPKGGLRPSQMDLIYGPSLALNKRAFVRCFGSELELLAIVNQQLLESAT